MRNTETSKHDYGHALLVAGAYGRMGCAILSARAALRSGCGLVSVHLPAHCVSPMQTAFPEAMVDIDASDDLFSTLPSSLHRYNALAVGPGIGTAAPTRQALLQLMHDWPRSKPLILDADAINIIASTLDFWGSRPFGGGLPVVITPHAVEYQRLFDDADPAEMARRHNLIIVKKAHRTRVYSPDGEIYENHTGNAGMATAGSGDVLTGILLGIAAQVKPTAAMMMKIACKGVAIHGETGDMAVASQSESSLVASDLVDNLKKISITTTGSYTLN